MNIGYAKVTMGKETSCAVCGDKHSVYFLDLRCTTERRTVCCECRRAVEGLANEEFFCILEDTIGSLERERKSVRPSECPTQLKAFHEFGPMIIARNGDGTWSIGVRGEGDYHGWLGVAESHDYLGAVQAAIQVLKNLKREIVKELGNDATVTSEEEAR